MTLHIRAPWLRQLANSITRRERTHPLRDAWERMQALQEGLDFAPVESPSYHETLPHHAEIIAISDYRRGK